MKIACARCGYEQDVQPPSWVASTGRPYRFSCRSCGTSQEVQLTTGKVELTGTPPPARPRSSPPPVEDDLEPPRFGAAPTPAPAPTASPPPRPLPPPPVEDRAARLSEPVVPSAMPLGGRSLATTRPFSPPVPAPPPPVSAPPVDLFSAPEAAPRPSSALYVKQEGEQLTVADLTTLRRFVAEGRVRPAALVSADGRRWEPLSNLLEGPPATPKAPAPPLPGRRDRFWADDDVPGIPLNLLPLLRSPPAAAPPEPPVLELAATADGAGVPMVPPPRDPTPWPPHRRMEEAEDPEDEALPLGSPLTPHAEPRALAPEPEPVAPAARPEPVAPAARPEPVPAPDASPESISRAVAPPLPDATPLSEQTTWVHEATDEAESDDDPAWVRSAARTVPRVERVQQPSPATPRPARPSAPPVDPNELNDEVFDDRPVAAPAIDPRLIALAGLLVTLTLAVGLFLWGGGKETPPPPALSPPAPIAAPVPKAEPKVVPEPAEPAPEPPPAPAPVAPAPAPVAPVAPAAPRPVAPRPAPEPAPPPPVPAPAPEPVAVAAPPPAPSGGSAEAAKVAEEAWANVDSSPTEALRAFQRALELDPRQEDALYGMGYVLVKLDRGGEALRYLCPLRSSSNRDVRREVQGIIDRNSMECP